jgi:serine protease Do
VIRHLCCLACLGAGLVFGGAGTPGQVAGSELRRTPLVRAVAATLPSVVNIRGRKTVPSPMGEDYPEGSRRVNGMGTGVFIDHRGYILTNYHVVDGVSRIQVTMHDGNSRIATLVAGNPDTDLAVIKVSGDEPYPVVHVGTSDDLMLGEPVLAIGNAFGYPYTITRGVISALHRTVEVSDTQKYEDLIQTDASINPGNSGGPLINADGEMIGLNAAVRIGAQGIGFAIPIDNALAMAADLLNVESVDDHWHGITARRVAGPAGPQLLVESIIKDSPAYQAGIRVGDVIDKVEDREIARAIDFERALIGRSTNEGIPITVSRQGETQNVNLVMTRRAAGPATDVAQQAWTLLGLRLQPIPASQFRNRSSRYRGGLQVTDVRENSPAQRQGIRAGDVLVGMHIWETISLENVAYVLRHADSEQVKFYILRGSDTLYGHLPMTLQRR